MRDLVKIRELAQLEIKAYDIEEHVADIQRRLNAKPEGFDLEYNIVLGEILEKVCDQRKIPCYFAVPYEGRVTLSFASSYVNLYTRENAR